MPVWQRSPSGRQIREADPDLDVTPASFLRQTAEDGVPELVERARNGDADAWDALYRRLYPKLLAYAGRRLSSADEAREAVSEAMVRAVAGIEKYAGRGAGFDAWLYGILRHVVLDAHRSRARVLVLPHFEEAADEPGPAERLLADEETTAVRAAFERLSAADQEILELRVVAQLSAEEVGLVLKRRPGAVRMAQHRALERLRHIVAEEKQ
jgi:RNA polymerase sigma-70 factor, ECF subfamily